MAKFTIGESSFTKLSLPWVVMVGIILFSGFIGVIGYKSYIQSKYSLLIPGNPDNPSILNFYGVVDTYYLDRNSHLRKKNVTQLIRIKKRAQRDPESLNKYIEAGKEVRNLSDSVIAEIDDILGGVLEDYNLNVDKRGIAESSDSYRKLRNVNKYFSDEKGRSLEEKLVKLRGEYLNLIPLADLEHYPFEGLQLASDIMEYRNLDHSDSHWDEFAFGGIPIRSVPVLLRRIINDIRITEGNILNYFLMRISAVDKGVTNFRVMACPFNSIVFEGETFEAFIFLSPPVSYHYSILEVFVNGESIPVNERALAIFRETAEKIGIREYEVQVNVTNPLNYSVTTFSNVFQYQVLDEEARIYFDNR